MQIETEDATIEQPIEWLEADATSGARSTATGIRARRQHGLLFTTTEGGRGPRFMLVNGFDAWVDDGRSREALTTQRYSPDVLSPDGARRIVAFAREPWPRWTFELDGGAIVTHECLTRPETPVVVLTFRLAAPRPGAMLEARPLMSGRAIDALHRENDRFRFEPREEGGLLVWRPYDGVPGVVVASNGSYVHDPQWYRQFVYAHEVESPDGNREDLASPGVFRFDVGRTEACWLVGVDTPEVRTLLASASAPALVSAIKLEEHRRRRRSS